MPVDDIRRRFLKFDALAKFVIIVCICIASVLGVDLLGRAFFDPVSADISISPSNVTVGDTVFQDGSLAVGASYVIFQEDGEVKAKNGTTGVIEFSGTDAATVIKSAIDALGTEGGKIFLKAAEYNITATIRIGGKNYLEIAGENRCGTKLRATASIANIIRQATDPIKDFVLRDIEVDGNGQAEIPIYFQGGLENIVLDNVYVHHAGASMVVFFDGVLGTNKRITLQNSHFAYSEGEWDIVGGGGEEFTVYNCIFGNDENKAGEGIAVANAKKAFIAFNRFISRTGYGFTGNAIHTEQTCSDVTVIGNYINTYSGRSIDIGGNVTRVVIEGNIIDATPAYTHGKSASGHIYLSGVRHGVVKNNVIEKSTWFGIYASDVEDILIEGNILIDAACFNVARRLGDDSTHQSAAIEIPNTGQAYTGKRSIVISENLVRNIDGTCTNGILVDDQYSHVFIHDNDLKDACGEKLYCIASNAVIKRNLGYITEASGTATIANGNTSVTFAHGLVGTPTLVVLGPTHSEVADAVWSADATNITITVGSAVTADRNISWYAEYHP